ncbi:MAG: dockerin type I domain-containing protein [bacterium]
MSGKMLTVALALLCLFAVALAGDSGQQPRPPMRSERPEQSPAATFTVTLPFAFGIPGDLLWAINSANASAGFDMITFNISGVGPHVIIPGAQLPALTDPAGCYIAGLSQPGSATGANPPSTATLMIEINGLSAGPACGLWVQSDNNVIDGLVINDFEQDGILIEAGVTNLTANFNMVYCCYVGTDPTGTFDIGNGRTILTPWAGVRIKNTGGGSIATQNIVDGCLSSGNYADGIAIWGPIVPGDVYGNGIYNCYIGTDRSGTADLGNDHEGVCLCEGTHDNWVQYNLISGNDYDGVGMQGYNNIPFPAPPIQTYANHVQDNIIGLDIALNPLPNTMYGVTLGTYGAALWGCADGNFIGPNNTIAKNGLAGVYVWEDGVDIVNGDRNQITQNSIYDNGGLGIDLFIPNVTFNDPTDPDVGANQEMNFPVITGIINMGGNVTVTGTLDTPAPNTTTIEVFRALLDGSGHGEGELYVGSTTPNALGNWSLTTTVLVAGDDVTATATDAVNNTSEFCLCVVVPAGGVVVCGDVDGSGAIDVGDLTYLVAYLFQGGPPPNPMLCVADMDGSGAIDVGDLTYLVAYLFMGGPAPMPGCCTPPW